jgi:type IV pilus assembly protein PilB
MGIDPTMVSATLRCSIAQRLVRKVCSQCRGPYVPATATLQEFGVPSKVTFVHGKGCVHCNFSGYSGRVPIVEMWAPIRDEALLINRRADNMTLRDAVFIHSSRRTMLEDGLSRVQAGITTLEEMLRMVPYEQIEEFRKKNQLRPFAWEEAKAVVGVR